MNFTRFLSFCLIQFLLAGFYCSFAMASNTSQPAKTGQTTCWDIVFGPEYSVPVIACPGTGLDGEYQTGAAWPNPRFLSESGGLRDHLTGLIWAVDAGNQGIPGYCDGGPTYWVGAFDYIACLNLNNYNGQNDWRVPNALELMSLVNFGEANPRGYLTGAGFSNVASFYWTSTTSALSPLNAITLTFESNTILFGEYAKGGHNRLVWPVREGSTSSANPDYPVTLWKTGQTTFYHTGDDGDLERGMTPPSPRFMENGDGTISDSLTGLMWIHSNYCAGAMPATLAFDWVDKLNNGTNVCSGYNADYSDWRIPNVFEVLSLYDFEHGGIPDTFSLYGGPMLTSTVNPGKPSQEYEAATYHHIRQDARMEGYANPRYFMLVRNGGSINTYTVTYNGNGNTGGTPPVDGNAYQENDEVTILNEGSLVKTGYTFNKWNTAIDGTGVFYTPGETFNMPGDNVTLYAFWAGSTRYVCSDEYCGGNTPCHKSVQEAVQAANTGTLIKIAAETHDGSFSLSSNKSLTLQGGWDAPFNNPNGGTTTLQVAPKAPQGSLTLQNLKIVP